MQLLRARRAIAAACTLACACDPYVRTTEIQMHDPSQAQATDVVSRTEVQTTPTSTSDLIVTSARRDDGSIVTEWQTRMPLVNGERHVLMTPQGKIQLEEHQTVDVTSDEATIHVCGSVAARTTKGTVVGYEARPGYPCGVPHMTEVDVTTPRSNVLFVDHVSTNRDRGFAIFGATLATAAFGTLGAILTFAKLKDKDGNDAGVGPKIFGVGFLALGATVDIALLPTIFAPNKRDRVFP